MRLENNHLAGTLVVIAEQAEMIQQLMDLNASLEAEVQRLKEKYESDVSEPGRPVGADEGSTSGATEGPGGEGSGSLGGFSLSDNGAATGAV